MCANRRTSVEDFMEEDELADNYSEELWEERHSRRGQYWMIEAARESVEREERDGEEDEE